MATKLSDCLSVMTAEEQRLFNDKLQGMQDRMTDVRMRSVRMSHEAERSSAMAFLNC